MFDQYLRTTKIPQLEYRQQGKILKFKWNNTVAGFKMPVRLKSHSIMITPSEEWQSITLPDDTPVEVNENYYIEILK